MASITEVFRAGNAQVGTIIRMAILSYFISAHNAQFARVLPGRDNARKANPNRRLPENFRQTWKPFPQPSGKHDYKLSTFVPCRPTTQHVTSSNVLWILCCGSQRAKN